MPPAQDPRQYGPRPPRLFGPIESRDEGGGADEIGDRRHPAADYDLPSSEDGYGDAPTGPGIHGNADSPDGPGDTGHADSPGDLDDEDVSAEGELDNDEDEEDDDDD